MPMKRLIGLIQYIISIYVFIYLFDDIKNKLKTKMRGPMIKKKLRIHDVI